MYDLDMLYAKFHYSENSFFLGEPPEDILGLTAWV